MQYQSTWQLPGQNPPSLIQLRIVPHGWDDAAYFCIGRSMPGKQTFDRVEEHRLTQPGSDRAVVRRYLDWVAANPYAVALFDSGLGLFPEEFLEPQGRRKTAAELKLDEAMLWTEVGDHEAARAVLDTLAEPPDGMFHHTVLRRLHANWAQDCTGEPAARHMQIALQHAQAIVQQFAQLEQQDEHAAQRIAYYFGNDYKPAASQVVAACTTLAEHWLQQQLPQAALDIAEHGIATHYGDGLLYELQVRALMALGRAEEAWPVYALRAQAIGPLPELTETEGYRAYAGQQAAQAQAAEQQRLASVTLDYHDSPPLGDAGQAQWRTHCPHLPQDFLSWLASGKRTGLTGSVEGEPYEYRLFDLRQSQDWHTGFMDWLNLHQQSSPDFHEELWQCLRDNGINPARMVPILGDKHTPDGFLLRCDGGPGEYGAVYFWSHEELPIFTKTTDNAQALMPWLAARLKSGEPFVL